MCHSRITQFLVSGALALALAACATGPAKGPASKPTATAHGAGPTVQASWKQQQQTLQDQLRIRLAATDATVWAVHDGLRVRMPAQAVFLTDAVVVRPEAQYLFEQLSQILRATAGVRLTVEVYADSLDDAATARAFTAERALAVVGVLQSQGIASERLQSRGAGRADPLGSSDTVEGRSANRRLEILISPLSF